VSNEGGRDFQDPNPGQQPPAPAADPGPQNEKGHALFTVTWRGERGGHVEFTVDSGPPAKKDCPRPDKHADGWGGSCTWAVSTVPGTTIGFTWFPDAPGMFAQCVLQAYGQQVDYQHVQGGSCAVHWAVVA
jgi:hypothetical protein